MSQDIWEQLKLPGTCPAIFYVGEWSKGAETTLKGFINAHIKPEGVKFLKRTTPGGFSVTDLMKRAPAQIGEAVPLPDVPLNMNPPGLTEAGSREAEPPAYNDFRALEAEQWGPWEWYSREAWECWEAQCAWDGWHYAQAWDVTFGAATQAWQVEQAAWQGIAAWEPTQAVEQGGQANNLNLAFEIPSQSEHDGDDLVKYWQELQLDVQLFLKGQDGNLGSEKRDGKPGSDGRDGKPGSSTD